MIQSTPMTERFQENQVAVIGGEGNMGKVTVELFQSLGYQAISSDTKNPESPNISDAISSSKIVFFSVLPVEAISRIVTETEDVFTPDHIVLDNASVKRPLIDAYKKLEAKGVSICSTHPLCKHDQPLHGQKALILNVGSNSQQAAEIAKRLYGNAGMVTIPLSFEDHDRTMTVVQLVPHLVMRSIGTALERSGVDMQKLREIAPANFQLFNLSMWRTLVQDPRISATLISNLANSEEGQLLAERIKSAIAQTLATKAQDELVSIFEQAYTGLNHDGIGKTMNDVTTIVLERLANLDVKSMIIEVKGDRSGLLREILLPFEEQGISLTAIDSHKSKGGIKFELGIDETTSTPESIMATVAALQKIGCFVTAISKNNVAGYQK